jgi:hypothetical protein
MFIVLSYKIAICLYTRTAVSPKKKKKKKQKGPKNLNEKKKNFCKKKKKKKKKLIQRQHFSLKCRVEH